MNDEELTNMIIKELGKHHDRQEVVRKVCENSTLGWVDAEKFINEVEAQNRRKIAVRQGPLLIFLSIGSDSWSTTWRCLPRFSALISCSKS